MLDRVGTGCRRDDSSHHAAGGALHSLRMRGGVQERERWGIRAAVGRGRCLHSQELEADDGAPPNWRTGQRMAVAHLNAGL